MTPTTDLAAVRQAAERLYDWTLQRGHPDKGRFGINPWNLDDSDIACGKRDDAGMTLALYALASLPERPGDPVTAEWLRECWGFRGSDNDGLVSPVCHSIGGGPMVELYYDPYGGCDSWSMGLGGEEIELPDRFQTRYQAAQFFTSLGIEPKKGEGV